MKEDLQIIVEALSKASFSNIEVYAINTALAKIQGSLEKLETLDTDGEN